MAKIKGKWLFNDVVKRHLDWLNEYQIENVFFYSNGERFTDMYWYDIDADDTVYHISYDETLAVAGLYGNIKNWENEAFKTIEFDGEQEVSDNFLAWMQENATQQASGGTATPTAESVKTKLQSLLTASNAKTGKSDANLTDAVKTLLEGYGQGGGTGGGGSSVLGKRIFNEQITFPEGIETLTEPYTMDGVEGFIVWNTGVNELWFGFSINSIIFEYTTDNIYISKYMRLLPIYGKAIAGEASADITEFIEYYGGAIEAYMDIVRKDGGTDYITGEAWFNTAVPATVPPTIYLTKCNNTEAEAWLLANTTEVE